MNTLQGPVPLAQRCVAREARRVRLLRLRLASCAPPNVQAVPSPHTPWPQALLEALLMATSEGLRRSHRLWERTAGALGTQPHTR